MNNRVDPQILGDERAADFIKALQTMTDNTNAERILRDGTPEQGENLRDNAHKAMVDGSTELDGNGNEFYVLEFQKDAD